MMNTEQTATAWELLRDFALHGPYRVGWHADIDCMFCIATDADPAPAHEPACTWRRACELTGVTDEDIAAQYTVTATQP